MCVRGNRPERVAMVLQAVRHNMRRQRDPPPPRWTQPYEVQFGRWLASLELILQYP